VRVAQGRVSALEFEQLTRERLLLCTEMLEFVMQCGALPPAVASDLAQVSAILAVTAHDVNVLAMRQWAVSGADLIGLSLRVGTNPPLTPADARVLAFVPSSMTAPEIARHLHVSPHTVKSHLGKIYRKLGVSSRADAVDRLRISGRLRNASGQSLTDGETITRLHTARRSVSA
jgi:DNA-binding CsgD family transcriptional regulator